MTDIEATSTISDAIEGVTKTEVNVLDIIANVLYVSIGDENFKVTVERM